jgi:hypothetical protein
MVIGIKRFLSLRVRRKIRRRAKSGLFVVLESAPGKHQIDDISCGGLSYYYVDTGNRSRSGAYRLRVISNNSPESVKLTGEIVSDLETGELVALNQKIKRRSIQFKRMNGRQKKMLKDLIRAHTIAWRPF